METEQQPQQPSPPAQTGPEQPPPPQTPPPAGWGAPPPPPANRARWSVRRTIVAVAVAVGIAAAGGVAIYAASNSGSDNQVGGPGGGPGGMRANGPVMGGPLADAEHGEFQNGEVTAISDDSITAKSDDGYTRTYLIDSDTVLGDGIEKGDDVTIVATTSDDDKATATMVTEQGQGMMPGRRDGRPGQGGPPTR
jgi:hypothetical protein